MNAPDQAAQAIADEVDKIMLPGVHDGVLNADYHAFDALGSSGLRKLTRSPAHFYAATLDPKRPVSEPTQAMLAGTRAHCMLLEQGEWHKRYAVRPDGIDLRTKDGKAWAAGVSIDLEIITAEQMLTAQRQATAIRALPEIGALLDNGNAEVSAFAIDEATGVMLKARPDWVSPAGDGACAIVDIKTCQSASPRDFPRSVVNFGYALQAAHYADVYEKASGRMVLGFVFACVEADYPHAAAAFMLPDEWLEMARRQRRRLIDLYATCRREGKWPGYRNTIEVLEMPRWLSEGDA